MWTCLSNIDKNEHIQYFGILYLKNFKNKTSYKCAKKKIAEQLCLCPADELTTELTGL